MKNFSDDFFHRPRKLLELENAEPSMFINDISKIFGRYISKAYPEDNASHGYRRIFYILCARDGITQVELAKQAGLSTPSVSTALNKMENDGLVRREHDKKDRRKVYVYITPKGRQQDDVIRRRFHDAEKIMLKDVTPAEREQLIYLLRKLLRNLLEEGDL